MTKKKEYSFIHKIINSIKITDFYIKVIHERTHEAFLYLFILALLLSIPTIAVESISTLDTARNLKSTLSSDDFPNYEITEGILVSDNIEPYTLSVNNRSIIIDSQNTYDLNKLIINGGGILLNSTSAILVSSGFKPQIYQYKDFFLIIMFCKTKELLISNIYLLSSSFIIATFIFSILQTIFMCLFTIMAAFMFISTRKLVFNLKLKRSQIFTLAIYSSTLPLIVYHLLIALPIPLRLLSFDGLSLISLATLFILLSYYAQQIIKLFTNLSTNIEV